VLSFKSFQLRIRKTNLKIQRAIILALLIFLNSFQFITAQIRTTYINSHPKLEFQLFYAADGLTANTVTSLFQDSRGFIWLGGAGLQRYDGYSFVSFSNRADDAYSLKQSTIWCIFEDHEGYLWLGTELEGLNRFDPATGENIRYLNNPEDSNSIGNGYIINIYEDHSNNLWIAVRDGGLNRLDRKTGKFTRYINNPDDPESISSNSVYSILEDSRGNFWIGTWGGGLNFMNRKTGKFSSYTYEPDNPNSLSNSRVTKIVEDPSGDLWISTMGGGLNRVSVSDKNLIDVTRIERDIKTDIEGGGNNIYNMMQDSHGIIWLATWGGGLTRYDPKTHLFSQYIPDDAGNDDKSFSDIYVYSLLEDKSGVLWAGTDDGLNKTDIIKKQFITYKHQQDNPKSFLTDNISQIFEDSQGNIWISSESMSLLKNRPGEGEELEFEHFVHSPDDPQSHPDAPIQKIIELNKDELLIGFRGGGVARFNKQTKKFIQYKRNPDNLNSLSNNVVPFVYKTKNGVIYVCTLGGGLLRFDIENEKFTPVPFKKEVAINRDVLRVWCMCEDRNGILWIGTRGGIIKYDPVKEKVLNYFYHDPNDKNSISDPNIFDLFEDSRGTIWFTTLNSGLNKYIPETNSFKSYTTKEGLPGETISSIVEDKNGIFWLGTKNGISRFNPQTEEIRNYDISDGIGSEDFDCCILSSDGMLYFGGTKGLTVFNPDSIKDNQHQPEISFTDFYLFNKRVEVGASDSPLQKDISRIYELILSYDQNVITFEFAALHFTNPKQNEYAYKLEGFEEEWFYIKNKREATFTNLDPGEYTLRVKAANSDGIWNDKVTALQLTILPPWWSTWWAYILYGLLFIAGLYLLRRYELNRINLKNQLKIERVESKTLRNLDQMKSHFFANISHEFRTPLTLILGQIESVLSSDSVDKIKGKLLVANINAKRLLALINQLLDLSKLESGGMKILATQIDLIPFLKNIFFSFESLAEKKEVLLQFNTELSKLEMYFDREKMEKIFLNLVSNAIKFSNEGGIVKIFVELNNEDDENPKALITVSNNGVGIPEDQQDHIFDRFYQVDSSQTRSHEGTGIGLALVKELVELHKGKISVKSKVDEGTVFTIELPVAKNHLNSSEIVPDNETRENQSATDLYITSESEYEIQDQEESNSENGFEADKDGGIILIVEDNKDIRTYIKDQLEENYKIVEAADGEAGLAAAKETIPDLIITDVMMPQMDGYEFAKNIRGDERSSHIPIIMLTARAADEDKISGLETGVDDYLIKPFNPKELQVRIKNLLEMRSLLRKRFSKALVIKPEEVSVIPADKKFMEKLISEIDKNLQEEDFTTAKLSNIMGMSMRTLSRKLNSLIDQSPSNFIRLMRLNRAAELLKKKVGNIAEVAYQVGFSDQAHFTRSFKKEFDLSPSDYAKKHS